MAASAKQLALTLCLMTSLVVGSACAASEALNNQEQDFVSRRLLRPGVYNIYHPAPSPSEANYIEPAPEKSYEAAPAPPSSRWLEEPPQNPNRDASVTVNCGDGLCADIWIASKKMMVLTLKRSNAQAFQCIFHTTGRLRVKV